MNRGTLFWGVVLILLGSLFLLQNAGLLQNVNIWGLLWPGFLMLLGVWILLGRFWRGSASVEHANVSLDGAARAHLRLKHGAGRIHLAAGSLGGDLVTGDFSGGVEVERQLKGDLLDVKLRVPSQDFPFFFEPHGLEWNLTVNREVPLTMKINTGASEASLDLSELRVSDVVLKTGASSITMTLPANAGFTRLAVESGAASLNLRIPAGVAARIRTRTGLGSVSVDAARFPRQGDYYQSPDYDTAANKADIDIESGVASVDVR
jgi:hypothetical protein